MSGKNDSVNNKPLFVLDENLSPKAADEMNCKGYNFRSLVEKNVLGPGKSDDEVIDWCWDNDATFVHRDKRLYTEHKKKLEEKPIKTLLLDTQGKRPRQLQILCDVIPRLISEWEENPSELHYKADYTLQLTPLDLEEMNSRIPHPRKGDSLDRRMKTRRSLIGKRSKLLMSKDVTQSRLDRALSR